jgi:hypothetical protein
MAPVGVSPDGGKRRVAVLGRANKVGSNVGGRPGGCGPNRVRVVGGAEVLYVARASSRNHCAPRAEIETVCARKNQRTASYVIEAPARARPELGNVVVIAPFKARPAGLCVFKSDVVPAKDVSVYADTVTPLIGRRAFSRLRLMKGP